MDHTENPALARRRPSWSALGAKLGRILQPGNEQPDDAYSSLPDDTDLPSLRKIPSPRMVEEGRRGDSDDASNLTSSTSNRSVSRGREGFQSSGRGGAGKHTQTVARSGQSGAPIGASFSCTRTGASCRPRAGANHRARRRGQHSLRVACAFHGQDSLQPSPNGIPHLAEEAARTRAKSSGRGGLGNISSRSRSRGPTALHLMGPSIHSTGRGGAGNLQLGSAIEAEVIGEILEAEDRARTSQKRESFYRPGWPREPYVGAQPSPEQLSLHNQAFESTGRGGSETSLARGQRHVKPPITAGAAARAWVGRRTVEVALHVSSAKSPCNPARAATASRRWMAKEGTEMTRREASRLGVQAATPPQRRQEALIAARLQASTSSFVPQPSASFISPPPSPICSSSPVPSNPRRLARARVRSAAPRSRSQRRHPTRVRIPPFGIASQRFPSSPRLTRGHTRSRRRNLSGRHSLCRLYVKIHHARGDAHGDAHGGTRPCAPQGGFEAGLSW
ncbi:hypothetical protein A0H81_02123 [Grifola frondosa]|uniref:Uncharacterized protein n=1 Tax=Grifola frondosa TaxID=5627 RepID=A0A1C7MPA6_GRIFR|nr:hypothetical protein A0H81_02123 [Grifola frondosa]